LGVGLGVAVGVGFIVTVGVGFIVAVGVAVTNGVQVGEAVTIDEGEGSTDEAGASFLLNTITQSSEAQTSNIKAFIIMINFFIKKLRTKV
jgi:hypothetical protein